MKGGAMTLPTVFISYSHKDEAWKDLLRPHIGVWKNRTASPSGMTDRSIPEASGSTKSNRSWTMHL